MAGELEKRVRDMMRKMDAKDWDSLSQMATDDLRGVVGEAVKALSEATKARRPETPWRQIAGLRELLAHEYYRIDMVEIDKIINNDLPALKAAITALRSRRT